MSLPVWQVSYLSGLAACVAVDTWGTGRAAGVPMRAAGTGSHHATPITAGLFAIGTMAATFWFTFAVILMARFASTPDLRADQAGKRAADPSYGSKDWPTWR